MEIISDHFYFPPGTGTRSQVQPLGFQKKVKAAHVALSGYVAQYTSEDHHVRELKVMLSTRLGTYNDYGVEVLAEFNLRDKNADDPYLGYAYFVLFVEFEDRLVPIEPVVP